MTHPAIRHYINKRRSGGPSSTTTFLEILDCLVSVHPEFRALIISFPFLKSLLKFVTILFPV